MGQGNDVPKKMDRDILIVSGILVFLLVFMFGLLIAQSAYGYEAGPIPNFLIYF